MDIQELLKAQHDFVRPTREVKNTLVSNPEIDKLLATKIRELLDEFDTPVSAIYVHTIGPELQIQVVLVSSVKKIRFVNLHDEISQEDIISSLESLGFYEENDCYVAYYEG